jgi:hypothetical protein
LTHRSSSSSIAIADNGFDNVMPPKESFRRHRALLQWDNESGTIEKYRSLSGGCLYREALLVGRAAGGATWAPVTPTRA